MAHLTGFALLDALRRSAARAADAAGQGPLRAPSRIVAEAGPMRVRAYQPRDASAGPVLVLIPAPIKRSYIWDLRPEVSVVRRCLARRLRVYMLEWLDPRPEDDGLGLADYAERLLSLALDAVAAETGRREALLAGHSLGGTFAAIFAALHPERVSALILIDAPLAFGAQGGPFARAVAASPHAAALRRTFGSPLPGCCLGLLAAAIAPDEFVARRWADLAASVGDAKAAARHLAVERWALDELAMPGRLFEEVVEQLYRGDLLRAGALTLGGVRVDLRRLRSPTLAVVSAQSVAVPPASTLAALPPGAKVLRHAGGRGSAIEHLGAVISPAAHARLWPEILDWACARWRERRPRRPARRPGA